MALSGEVDSHTERLAARHAALAMSTQAEPTRAVQ
ncbi:hypothetical protein [Microbacterium sp. PAMC22086]